MQALEVSAEQQLAVNSMTAELLRLPQADCPVVHRFGPGIYIREVTFPAGVTAVGFYQKTEHVNIMLAGKVTMLNADGTTTLVEAPYFAVLPPGQKVGYVHEEMVWQNIYATDETDVAKLEAMYLDKNVEYDDYMAGIKPLDRQVDRDDFLDAITSLGFTPEEVRRQSETGIVVPLPHGSYKIRTAPSLIEGIGVFATGNIKEGDLIAPARLGDVRTVAGRYTNHGKEPNAKFILYPTSIILQATHDIEGMKGGQLGEEITVDYRETYKISEEFQS